jgi:N-methylhydantoinase A
MGLLDLEAEGIIPQNIEIHPSIDLRYTGQSYELNIPYTDNFIADFHSAHSVAYGYSYPERSVEIVNLRVRSIGKIIPIKLPQVNTNSLHDKPALLGLRQVYLRETASSLPVYDYDALVPGMRLTGPAIIVSSDTTIFINTNDVVNVDIYQNLLIDVYTDKSTSKSISGLKE